MVVMMNMMYGRVDIDTFLGSWLPLMHIVATKGIVFNWEIILGFTLKTNIQATNNLERV